MDTSVEDTVEIVEETVALKRLRQAVRAQRDLPALSLAPARLASLAANPQVRESELTRVALSDPALALRLLRVANGSNYSSRDRSEVVTVGRAIALLGHDQIASHARQVRPATAQAPNRRQVLAREELAAAAFASQFAHLLLETRNPLVADEGAVTTMIASLLNVALATHAPHELTTLRYVRLHHAGQLVAVQRELFSITTEALGQEVIEAWSLPRTPMQVIARAGMRPTPAMSGRDWLPLAVGLATEVARCIQLPRHADRERELHAVSRRFSHGMSINDERLHDMIAEAASEAIELELSYGPKPQQRALQPLLEPYLEKHDLEPTAWSTLEKIDGTGVITRFKMRSIVSHDADRTALPGNAAGKPYGSEAMLRKLVEDMDALALIYAQAERDDEFATMHGSATQRIMKRFLPLMLQGIRQCLGYERVVWFARVSADDDLWLPSAAAGVDPDHLRAMTSTRLAKQDLFMAVLRNAADVHIADCTSEKIATSLPPWFRVLYPHTHSFLIMPVKSHDQYRGFILADRPTTDPAGLSAEELTQIRLLRTRFGELLDEFGVSGNSALIFEGAAPPR